MSWRLTYANHHEQTRSLPGDEFIEEPIGSFTHAITIRCRRRDVWPWLVQMGAGRAGWYSYDFIDNGGQRSAERILPEFQTIAVGDVLPWLPGATEGFIIVQYEAERSLVLGWRLPDGTYLTTWAFVLEDAEHGSMRLIVRARGGLGYHFHDLPTWISKLIVPLGHFVMQRKQLLGIARRAESCAKHALGPMNPPMPAALDPFIPHPDVRERHETIVHAPAELVLEVARHFDMYSLPLVRAIFWLRAKLLRAKMPAADRPKGLVAETLGMGWGPLAEQPGRLFIAAAVCQPWHADVVFTAIPPDRFAAYAEPDRVKIAWTLEAEPLTPILTRFATETRVVATDDLARAKFGRYWRWAGMGIVAIRWLLLPAVRRQAEGRWRAAGDSAVDLPVSGAVNGRGHRLRLDGRRR